MKKIFFLAFLLSATLASAQDITARDGTRYTNATVLKTMPDGIVVHYTDQEGFDDVRLVKFTELPDDLQKKYGYDPARARAFENSLKQAEANEEKAEENKEKAAREKEDKENELIQSAMNKVNERAVSFSFKSIANIPEGCVGWGTPDGEESSQSIRICILNINMDQGFIQECMVVPVDGKTVDFNGDKVPCYLTTKDAFVSLYENQGGPK